MAGMDPPPFSFGTVNTAAHPAFDPGPEGGGAQLFSLNYGKSIGTALHPIRKRFADAPFDREDAEPQAMFERLLTLAERLIGVARSPLKLLKRLECLFPGWLRGGLRAVLGAGRSLGGTCRCGGTRDPMPRGVGTARPGGGAAAGEAEEEGGAAPGGKEARPPLPSTNCCAC
jgi:hypothetical protein